MLDLVPILIGCRLMLAIRCCARFTSLDWGCVHVFRLLGKPVGIFSLLDEECRLATGSDKSCVTKLDKAFAKQQVYMKDKLNPLSFGVLHYAGYS